MRIFDSRHIASMDIQYDVDASEFIPRVERLGLIDKEMKNAHS